MDKENSKENNKLIKDKKKKFNRSMKPIIIVGLIFLSLIILFRISDKIYEKSLPEEVTYNEFISMVEANEVDTVYYDSSQEYMRFTLYNDESRELSKEELEEYEYSDEYWRTCLYPANTDFRKELLLSDVKLEIRSFQSIKDIFIDFVVQWGIFILLIVFMANLMAKTTTIGNSTDILISENDVAVRFSDVIGHEEVINDLKFITKMMTEKSKKQKLSANFPKGILFTGAPGTGKTLLAKAIAGEAGVPFLYMNASNFIEMYVGVGAKRVRELFKKARKMSPCIIFIDEIDAIGSSRNRSNISSEDTQTINALLQEMDGFSSAENKIIVIAATNNAESLDSALVRAGRFDRQIEIAPPKDWTIRKELFMHYLENKSLSEDVNLDRIAKETVGFTGADIASIVNEASIIALSHSHDVICMVDLEDAIDKKLLKGNKSTKKQEEKVHQICAYHEAGHAVMCYLLHHNIFRASIIGTTNGVGGFVLHADDDKNPFKTKQDIKDEIMISYGGRCSEEIKFGIENITTGAISDIQNATSIISNYVSVFGFNNELINYKVLSEAGILDDNKDLKIQIINLASELKTETDKILKENYYLVESLAKSLIEKETMSGEEITELLDACVSQ